VLVGLSEQESVDIFGQEQAEQGITLHEKNRKRHQLGLWSAGKIRNAIIKAHKEKGWK
jgi:hypothetical protein